MRNTKRFSTATAPFRRPIAILAVVVGLAGAAKGSTIDFEQYGNGLAITNQYTGVSFVNAVEATSTAYAFAASVPSSGTGFLASSSDMLEVLFDAPVSSVSGFYASYYGSVLNAYGVDGTLLSSTSLAANYGTHSAWGLSSVEGIRSLSFVAPASTEAIDDMTYLTASAPTPEPGSLFLMATGLMGGAAFCVQRAARKQGSA